MQRKSVKTNLKSAISLKQNRKWKIYKKGKTKKISNVFLRDQMSRKMIQYKDFFLPLSP